MTTNLSGSCSSSDVVTRCCLFCCKIYRHIPGESPLEENNNGNLEERFTKLLESHSLSSAGQYFGSPGDTLEATNLNGHKLEAVIRLGCVGEVGALFRSCGDCWRTLNLYCDAVHRLKVAKMEADWRLRQLTELMRNAEAVPGRSENFKAFLEAYLRRPSESVDDPGEISVLRKNLLEMSSSILKHSFSRTPRILLQRCKPPKVNIFREPCLSTVEDDDDEDNGPQDEAMSFADSPGGAQSGSEYCPSDEHLEAHEEFTKVPSFPPSLSPSITAEPSHNGVEKPREDSGASHLNSRTEQGIKRQAPNIHHNSEPISAIGAPPKKRRKYTLLIPKSRRCAAPRNEAHPRPVQTYFNRTKKYKCDICSKMLISVKTLELHKSRHFSTPGKRYSCVHCDHVPFATGSGLDYHIFYNHKDKLLSDFKVDTTSDSEFVQVIATVLKTYSKEMRCTLCDTNQKQYSRRYDVERHAIQHHSPRLSEDLKRYQKDPEFMRALKEKMAKAKIARKPFICHICMKAICDPTHFQRHLALHVNYNVPCLNCDKTFRNKEERNLHSVRIHKTQFLRKYKMDGSSEEDFSEAVDAALEQLIDNVRCVLCRHLCRSKAHCAVHLTERHAQRLGAELRKFQEEGALESRRRQGPRLNCEYCDAVFTSRCKRVLHELCWHPEKVLVKYQAVGTSTPDFARMIKNVFRKLVSKGPKYECTLCEKQFRAPLLGRSHVLKEHEQRFAQEMRKRQKVKSTSDANLESEPVADVVLKEEMECVGDIRNEIKSEHGTPLPKLELTGDWSILQTS